MNDGVIVQQVYARHEWWWNEPFKEALELVRPRHQAYANKWHFDYLVVIGEVREDWLPNHGGWAKVELMRQMLAKGYQYVIWIDADAMIIDMDTDLREGCPQGLGMVLHHGAVTPGPHLNVGVMMIQNSEKVRAFFDEWASRYPGTNEFPWYEQGEANKMAKEPKWQGVVIQIEDKWNSCIAAENHVDNAVIEGWHGMGDAYMRLQQMQEFIKTLDPESGQSRPRAKRGEVKES